MRIIFDENVPLPLKAYFKGHSVSTVQQQGWTGVENGSIIQLIDGQFDVLLLADKNLRYQQNLKNRKIALVELPTNRWPVLKTHAESIVRAVEAALPASYSVISFES